MTIAIIIVVAVFLLICLSLHYKHEETVKKRFEISNELVCIMVDFKGDLHRFGDKDFTKEEAKKELEALVANPHNKGKRYIILPVITAKTK